MKKISKTLRNLRVDQHGNVMMMFGFALIPMVFATGMGIDYARAMKAQTKLNAAADAAALTAVSQTMMLQTDKAACARAREMFLAQSGGMSAVTLKAGAPQISIKDGDNTVYDCATVADGQTSSSRVVTVSYSGTSANAFSGILGMATLPIGGSSQSLAAVAPDIDFYVMVDMSQSMLLPATTADLASMISATQAQGGGKGCAFACHQTETRPYSYDGSGSTGSNSNFIALAGDISTNPIIAGDVTPNGYARDVRRRKDNYQVARDLGLTLRTDLVKEAVADLTQEAETSSVDNGATYRMGLTSFDNDFKKVWPTTGNVGDESTYFVDEDLDEVSTRANSLEIEAYYLNNRITPTNSDNDTHTRFHDAFTGILGTMPSQGGTGGKDPSDEPQAILFLITDGMWDNRYNGGVEGPIWNVRSSGRYVRDTSASRVQFCDDVKARNIRIAVLYTQYLPSSASDQWSIDNVLKPHLQPTDKVAQALEACASTGLYYKVSTDDDISLALRKLFQKAVATARLTR